MERKGGREREIGVWEGEGGKEGREMEGRGEGEQWRGEGRGRERERERGRELAHRLNEVIIQAVAELANP